MTYNGWTNYETWNVSLWLNNDEYLYNLTQSCDNYQDLIQVLKDCGLDETLDGVKYNDNQVDVDQINELVFEV